MPSSHFRQLSTIMELIVYTNPQSILDIGVGVGKYGLLTREYLEIWGANSKLDQWDRQIDGIEAFEKYLTPVHNYSYDKIYIGDVREILPAMKTKYDLILMIAILEYIDHDSGQELIKKCLEVGRNILISTDTRLRPSENLFSSPFENDRFEWKKKHFDFLDNKFFISTPYNETYLCFSGPDFRQIRQMYTRSKAKAALNRIFPFLRKLRAALRISEQ